MTSPDVKDANSKILCESVLVGPVLGFGGGDKMCFASLKVTSRASYKHSMSRVTWVFYKREHRSNPLVVMEGSLLVTFWHFFG